MHTCVDAHSGAVFRSGEDAHLRRCVHASTRRHKRAQGRRYDAEIKQLFWAPSLTSSQKSEGSKGSLNYQAHEMCMEVHIPKLSSQRQVCHSVRGRARGARAHNTFQTPVTGGRSAFSLVQEYPKSQNFSPAAP